MIYSKASRSRPSAPGSSSADNLERTGSPIKDPPRRTVRRLLLARHSDPPPHASWASLGPDQSQTRPLFLPLFTEARGRSVLGRLYPGKCITSLPSGRGLFTSSSDQEHHTTCCTGASFHAHLHMETLLVGVRGCCLRPATVLHYSN